MLDLRERFRLGVGPRGAQPLQGGIFGVASECGRNVLERLTERHLSDGHRGAKRLPSPPEGLSLAPELGRQRRHTGRLGERLRDQGLEEIEQDSS